MNYKDITLNPLSKNSFPPFSAGFSENPNRFCDNTDGNTWIWADYLSACLIESDGFVALRRRMMDGTPTYTALSHCPLSTENIDRLRLLAKQDGHCLCLFPLSETEKEDLLFRYPDGKAETSPDWRDYVYSLPSLATFHGKKYNGQRNHLNAFRKLYPEAECVPFDESYLDATLRFLETFYSESPTSPPIEAEKDRLVAMLQSRAFSDEKGMYANVLLCRDGVVALAVGEVQGDTLYVHAEKALRAYRGAYQAIVSGFASRFLDGKVEYVNREEDDGNPGLRTSKLSYHPLLLLEKWRFTLPSVNE